VYNAWEYTLGVAPVNMVLPKLGFVNLQNGKKKGNTKSPIKRCGLSY